MGHMFRRSYSQSTSAGTFASHRSISKPSDVINQKSSLGPIERVMHAYSYPMSANIIERRLGMTDTTNNYPINSTLMRRIPYEKIIDASRKALIEENFFSVANNIPLVHPLNETLLSKPKKVGRKFDRADSFYREIATRYMEAQSIGGSVARKPALYIAKYIEDEVKHLSDEYKSVQIRKWVAEARKRGYIPPVSRQQ